MRIKQLVFNIEYVFAFIWYKGFMKQIFNNGYDVISLAGGRHLAFCGSHHLAVCGRASGASAIVTFVVTFAVTFVVTFVVKHL